MCVKTYNTPISRLIFLKTQLSLLFCPFTLFFSFIDYLNVAKNHFDGEFPSEWTSMAGLRELDVSSNELKGKIPIFVDGMKNLRLLNMARNDLSDTIPSELGR